MLPTLVREAPEGHDWLHEIKYDGYRTQLHLSPTGARAFTRNGHDWTHLYRFVLADAVLASSAIIDGEIIVQDELGRSNFHALKATIKKAPERLVFMAFDLLHLDGQDLRNQPLLDRRVRLQELIGGHDPERRIQYSEHLTGTGAAMFNVCDSLGLEGIVSKRLHSRYCSGRSRDWLKVKCWAEGEFVVLGIEPAQDGPAVALLAREGDDRLEYAGGAAITLAEPHRDRFWREVEQLVSSNSTTGAPKSSTAQWIRPELRVRARYLKDSGKLRHATLLAVL